MVKDGERVRERRMRYCIILGQFISFKVKKNYFDKGNESDDINILKWIVV